MQTSFGFGFGSPTTMKHIKIVGANRVETAASNRKMTIGSTGAELRFVSRGMSLISPAGGVGMPTLAPHSGGQLKPIEGKKYNI